MARAFTHSFTSGSVTAGSSLDINRTGLLNAFNIVRIKVTPNTGGAARVQIFQKDTFTTTDLVYSAGPFTALIDPIEDTTQLERNQYPVCFYEDEDATDELHIRIYNDHTAAQTYAVEVDIETLFPRVARVSSTFSKTSDTTLANITGLTHDVIAGDIYAFEAILYTGSNTSGGVKAAIAGTATATAIIYEAVVIEGTAISAHTRATAMATEVGGVTAVANAYIRITGTITVNAAGTLTVQFAQNASNGTASEVLVGSIFTLTRKQ